MHRHFYIGIHCTTTYSLFLGLSVKFVETIDSIGNLSNALLSCVLFFSIEMFHIVVEWERYETNSGSPAAIRIDLNTTEQTNAIYQGLVVDSQLNLV